MNPSEENVLKLKAHHQEMQVATWVDLFVCLVFPYLNESK